MRYSSFNKVDFSKVTRNEKNVISCDTSFLMNLYSIQSPSNHERSMINFLKEYLGGCNQCTDDSPQIV